jgi:hypothetical protein
MQTLDLLFTIWLGGNVVVLIIAVIRAYRRGR